jgi:hypothetical protein
MVETVVLVETQSFLQGVVHQTHETAVYRQSTSIISVWSGECMSIVPVNHHPATPELTGGNVPAYWIGFGIGVLWKLPTLSPTASNQVHAASFRFYQLIVNLAVGHNQIVVNEHNDVILIPEVRQNLVVYFRQPILVFAFHNQIGKYRRWRFYVIQ